MEVPPNDNIILKNISTNQNSGNETVGDVSSYIKTLGRDCYIRVYIRSPIFPSLSLMPLGDSDTGAIMPLWQVSLPTFGERFASAGFIKGPIFIILLNTIA